MSKRWSTSDIAQMGETAPIELQDCAVGGAGGGFRCYEEMIANFPSSAFVYSSVVTLVTQISVGRCSRKNTAFQEVS